MKEKNKLIIRLAGLGLAITFLAYGWFFGFSYFFSDDFTWLWFGKLIVGDPKQFFALRATTNFSPVMNAGFAIFYWLFGPYFPAYFIFGLLVHAGVCLVSGFLAFRLTKSRAAGYLTVIFVALAGGAYEPVIWIGAIIHSFAAIFIVLAVLFYLYARESGKRLALLASFVAALVAITTKETAVVIPLLIIGAAVFERGGGARLNKYWQRAYASAFALSWAIYLYYEYFWQRDNIAVTTGTWRFGWQTLIQLPTTIAAMIFPAQYILSAHKAPFIILFTVAGLTLVWYKFRKVAGVNFGLAWTLVSLLPTVLFVSSNWWEPLAPRYMYLPRIGLMIALAAVAVHLSSKTARRKIAGYLSLVFVMALIQLTFILSLFGPNYSYIYQTGRSLAAVAATLRGRDVNVLVAPDHPFPNNDSYILGGLSVFGNIEQNKVFFIRDGESVFGELDQVILKWDARRRSFVLR